jgi:hypothetical protein
VEADSALEKLTSSWISGGVLEKLTAFWRSGGVLGKPTSLCRSWLCLGETDFVLEKPAACWRS